MIPLTFLSGGGFQLKSLLDWPYLAFWIGLFLVICLILFYKYRQREYFKAEFARTTMAYFNLAKKLGQSSEYQSESLAIHNDLDSIQNDNPKAGLQKLADINHRINQLKLRSDTTSGK
ncbi:MAG: hypothetical protein OEZ36_05615 [Spirochaetota bacterium]|nr:hypothetical protein [Spirochaetota bacterium]